MQTSNHILAKEGILASFMIAKRINAADIKRLKDSIKGSNPKPSKMQELLSRKIVEETQAAFETKQIPGLMIKEVIDEQEEKKRIMELTYFASVMAKKLTDNNVGKYHACYVVNAIVNMLGLTEGDFDDFHRRFARFKEGKSEDDESTFE
jgi:hypothetical protein